jgi:hypothetical protein
MTRALMPYVDYPVKSPKMRRSAPLQDARDLAFWGAFFVAAAIDAPPATTNTK